MLHYDRIDVYEGIDINKTSASKDCDICHYWYFLNKGFKFQPNNKNVKSYDGQTKWMYVLIEDDDLLEKCNAIWDKFSVDIKKEFDSEPVYNKKLLKYQNNI